MRQQILLPAQGGRSSAGHNDSMLLVYPLYKSLCIIHGLQLATVEIYSGCVAEASSQSKDQKISPKGLASLGLAFQALCLVPVSDRLLDRREVRMCPNPSKQNIAAHSGCSRNHRTVPQCSIRPQQHFVEGTS